MLDMDMIKMVVFTFGGIYVIGICGCLFEKIKKGIANKRQSYYGFYKVKHHVFYISYKQYYDFVHSMGLVEDMGMADYSGENAARKANYQTLTTYFNQLYKTDREQFNKYLHFDYNGRTAQELTTDFLDMYIGSHSGFDILYHQSHWDPIYTYGRLFYLYVERPFSTAIKLQVDINKVCRLSGTATNWRIDFSNDMSYIVKHGRISVVNQAPRAIFTADKEENENTEVECSSFSESMIGDSWHAKGRVMIAIGAIIAGALLAFIMK